MSETNTTARAPRKERIGQVLSNKMDKTIVVRVERRIPHPRFKKIITRYRKFYAHDEKKEGTRSASRRPGRCLEPNDGAWLKS